MEDLARLRDSQYSWEFCEEVRMKRDPAHIVRQRMRLIRTFILLVVAYSVSARAQIQSISTFAEYASPLNKRLNVQSASAIGGGVEVSLKLYENASIGLRAAYVSYSIDQPDQLNQWNWNFWNDRYYPKIQSDMRADPNLTAQIGSFQSMDMIPVSVAVNYSAMVDDNLTIVPKLAGGVSFFTRKLYADETWTKQFPRAEYTLTYNLRNFAPEKKGTVIFLAPGCDAGYQISSDVSITVGVQYKHYVSSITGHGDFPLENEIIAKLGLTFFYR